MKPLSPNLPRECTSAALALHKETRFACRGIMRARSQAADDYGLRIRVLLLLTAPPPSTPRETVASSNTHSFHFAVVILNILPSARPSHRRALTPSLLQPRLIPSTCPTRSPRPRPRTRCLEPRNRRPRRRTRRLHRLQPKRLLRNRATMSPTRWPAPEEDCCQWPSRPCDPSFRAEKRSIKLRREQIPFDHALHQGAGRVQEGRHQHHPGHQKDRSPRRAGWSVCGA